MTFRDSLDRVVLPRHRVLLERHIPEAARSEVPNLEAFVPGSTSSQGACPQKKKYRVEAENSEFTLLFLEKSEIWWKFHNMMYSAKKSIFRFRGCDFVDLISSVDPAKNARTWPIFAGSTLEIESTKSPTNEIEKSIFGSRQPATIAGLSR